MTPKTLTLLATNTSGIAITDIDIRNEKITYIHVTSETITKPKTVKMYQTSETTYFYVSGQQEDLNEYISTYKTTFDGECLKIVYDEKSLKLL
jgi:hypothetical protein